MLLELLLWFSVLHIDPRSFGVASCVWCEVRVCSDLFPNGQVSQYRSSKITSLPQSSRCPVSRPDLSAALSSLLALCRRAQEHPCSRGLIFHQDSGCEWASAMPACPLLLGSLPHQWVPAFSEPCCCSSLSWFCLSPASFVSALCPLTSALFYLCVSCLVCRLARKRTR